MISSHLNNRACYMSELNMRFVTVIIRRMLLFDKSLKVLYNKADVTEMFVLKY